MKFFIAFSHRNLLCEKLDRENIMTALVQKMIGMKDALKSKLLQSGSESEENNSYEG